VIGALSQSFAADRRDKVPGTAVRLDGLRAVPVGKRVLPPGRHRSAAGALVRHNSLEIHMKTSMVALVVIAGSTGCVFVPAEPAVFAGGPRAYGAYAYPPAAVVIPARPYYGRHYWYPGYRRHD